MPPASKTEHHATDNTALPYISNSSIIDTSKQFITGSENLFTSLRHWSERRPGFAVSPVVFPFVNLQRDFTWERWAGVDPNAGRFVRMFSDTTGIASSKVYKMVLGVDPLPVLLWTSTSAEPFDFVVSNNFVYFGNGTDMKKYNTGLLSNWGIAAPTVGPTPSFTTGSLAIYTSWYYCYTYWNANSGHESSPSPLSFLVSPFTGHSVNVFVTASTDPQVSNIRVYRTPDGGAQDPSQMQEIIYGGGGGLPANTTGNVNDATLDVNLSIRTAPAFLRNDPPTPSKGFVPYAGRIWSFANNTTYYSGFEEIQNGVPEESWPSGLDGNFEPFDKEIFAQAPLIDGIAVFTSSRIYKIEGDSLDTFRRYTLLERRGTRSRTAIASIGGSVAWLDTSNTVWISDLGEISIPVRPDFQNINPLTCWITIHISGLYHWLVVLDGTAGNLFVYDLDTSQWMPPWTVGASSALASYETSQGNVQLSLALNNSRVWQLTNGNYADGGNLYGAILSTNMYRLTPDSNPSFNGVHAWSEIKTDTQIPVKVEQLTDDDPTQASYKDITGDGEASPDLKPGNFLLTTRWPSYDQTAQLMAMRFTWPAVNKNFHLYQMDEAFYPFGG